MTHLASLRAALIDQGRHCAALGSPFMGRLMPLLADHWRKGSAIDRICQEFSGDLGPKGASLPLRLAGGLHALVRSGRDAELAGVYPPHVASDAALIAQVLRAFDDHIGFFRDWMASPPQTNEIRRSVALIPAAQIVAERFCLPLKLSELGASGGLNLGFDRMAIETPQGRLGPGDAAAILRPDWRGNWPRHVDLQVAERRGVDLNPLNPGDANDRLRLLAYLWPDQPERRALTEAAMAQSSATVDQGDAIGWLQARLSAPAQGQCHVIYHTIAWQYFPKAAQDRGCALIEAAGACATNDAPIAWISLEADGDDRGAALTLQMWPDGGVQTLARVDFHGRWVDWGG